MRKLSKPNYSADYSFKTCISRVRNNELKRKLSSICTNVENASLEYDQKAVVGRLHEISPSNNIAGVVTKEEMEAVYTQRMVGSTSPGRHIYDEIVSSAPNGRCPLCGHRNVETLDHHLPKSHYPIFAVTPINLVPACGSCNKSKLSHCPTQVSEVPLHPYFDDIDDDSWLIAQVIEERPSALLFSVTNVDTWDAILSERVSKQFKMLKLGMLYASEAADELLNIRHQLIGIHDDSGASGVHEELNARATSCANNHRNSWRTAAYTAWANSDWFCNGGFLDS